MSYKLRDWLFSRQRYWGEPFPIVFDEDGVSHAVPDSMLPVELPDVPDYSPKTFEPEDASSQPEPPLGRVEEWVNVELDLGDGRGVRKYRRETNTMPNWAGSCWYYLRYLDPANAEAFVDPENEAYWMGPQPTPVATAPDGVVDPGGVDLYIGGVEHAVLHLLYARFWHKVLHDLGHVSSDEPFRKYFSQGYIQAAAYRDDRGQPVESSEVVEVTDPDSGEVTYTWNGQAVTREYGKIGKSLKNVVSPDEMFEQYGADTLRVYEMSMGPLELSKPWETRAVVGAQRFLQRLWRNVIDEETGEVRVADAPLDDATAQDPAPHHRRGVQGLPDAGLQHRHRPADRAEQRPDQARRGAARGRREAGRHGRAAGPAHRRGAVAATGSPRVDHLRELPGGRPGPAGRGHRHLRRADQGQGPRPVGGAGRHHRGRPARAGAGAAQGRRRDGGRASAPSSCGRPSWSTWCRCDGDRCDWDCCE